MKEIIQALDEIDPILSYVFVQRLLEPVVPPKTLGKVVNRVLEKFREVNK